jgi:hypothetical protein
MAFDVTKIEEKIDKVVTGGIELSEAGFGIEIKRLIDAMEVAKLMAISGPAVPLFMRGNPGICYAIVVRAVRWGMDPFFVAEQSYLVKNPKTGEEKIAFMAQLIVAVINARAPLQKKLWAVYEGRAEAMKATILGLPKGQIEPLDYETPTLAELIAIKGRNDYGNVKGSPLYDHDPKQALWYYGARAFCRRHFPEVLAGVYDGDELGDYEPKDVTPEKPSLSQRLSKQKKIAAPRGFDADHIARETTQVPDPETAPPSTTEVTQAGSGEGAAPMTVPGPVGAAPDVATAISTGS